MKTHQKSLKYNFLILKKEIIIIIIGNTIKCGITNFYYYDSNFFFFAVKCDMR